MEEGYYFIDTRLPFGLRSSPAIFNQFADLLCWILQYKYQLKFLVHYADDFFLVSSKIHLVANSQLKQLCTAFSDLGIPLAYEKIVGPVTEITYLGILFATIQILRWAT